MSDNQSKRKSLQETQVDEANKDLQFRRQAEEDLKNDQRIQEYLAGFSPDTVERFVNDYLTNKTNWYKYGEFYLQQKDKNDLQWISKASEQLKIIQQKKLFDLQCLWRAEKVELPGVEISWDFKIWERDILNCPFVPHITSDEVELYQQYLEQSGDVYGEDVLRNSFIGWQSYNELKDAYNSENSMHNFPGWYDFHNGRTGAGTYMTLHDIRGQKESYYRMKYLDTKPETKKALNNLREAFVGPTKRGEDKEGRPHLYFYTDAEKFVEKFEDKLTREYYRASKWWMRNRDEEEDLQEITDMLIDSGEEIAIEGHYDWKQALRETATKFKVQKIIEMLPGAFEQYHLNISMGIGFPKKDDVLVNARQQLINDILTGRRLCGEPEDLNF